MFTGESKRRWRRGHKLRTSGLSTFGKKFKRRLGLGTCELRARTSEARELPPWVHMASINRCGREKKKFQVGPGRRVFRGMVRAHLPPTRRPGRVRGVSLMRKKDRYSFAASTVGVEPKTDLEAGITRSNGGFAQGKVNLYVARKMQPLSCLGQRVGAKPKGAGPAPNRLARGGSVAGRSGPAAERHQPI